MVKSQLSTQNSFETECWSHNTSNNVGNTRIGTQILKNCVAFLCGNRYIVIWALRFAFLFSSSFKPNSMVRMGSVNAYTRYVDFNLDRHRLDRNFAKKQIRKRSSSFHIRKSSYGQEALLSILCSKRTKHILSALGTLHGLSKHWFDQIYRALTSACQLFPTTNTWSWFEIAIQLPHFRDQLVPCTGTTLLG
jgi:hypothetical protein